MSVFKLGVFLLLILNSGEINAEIYKWIDAQGKTHYGDKPVGNAKEMDVDVTKQGNLKTNSSRAWAQKRLLESYADDRKREKEASDKKKKEKKRREKNCVLLKDKMREYNRARSLYDLDKKGNRTTLSNEERLKAEMELKNKIKKYCK